uniref:Palmitoleoyl-protein carboxylesterase NOTUM n=1 Tax=Sus scrofa TaxID=9823 RepID=A0A480IKB3_PIG
MCEDVASSVGRGRMAKPPPGGGSTGWEQGGQPSWFAWNPVDFPHRACEGPSRTQMTRSPFGGGEWDSGPGPASEGWTLGWDPGGTEVWTRPGPAAAGGALTAQGWEDFVAKEAVPLLALLELAPTALWDHPVPVPDAPADGLRGRAGDGVDAVGAAVLLVVQEPARVGQAPHLDGGVAQLLQLLGHAVHVQ